MESLHFPKTGFLSLIKIGKIHMKTQKEIQKVSQELIVLVNSQQISDPKKFFFGDENEPALFYIKQWLLTHRLKTRLHFLQTTPSSSTILSLLPLFFGFVHFLKPQLTSRHNFETLFEKTLPVFANLKPKLKYETFQYILKSNGQSTGSETSFFLGQPQFLATLKTPNCKVQDAEVETVDKGFSTHTINGLAYDFFTIASGKSAELEGRHLDELPAYFQGLKGEGNRGFEKNEKIEPRFRQALFDLSGKEKKQVSPLGSFEQKTSLKRLSSVDTPPNKLRLLQKKLFQISENKQSLKDSFWQNRLDFYRNLEQLDSEFQKLFLDKKLSGFVEETTKQEKVFLLNSFLQESLLGTDDNVIETVLCELEKQVISEDAPYSRLMSGYKYPDTSSLDLSWFYKHQQFNQTFFQKYQKEAQPFSEKKGPGVETTRYNLSVRQIPRFVIKTQPVVLENKDKSESFYDGPGLALDSERAFDWQTYPQNGLRSWFHKYLSPFNPFTQIQENFFGIYQSPQLSTFVSSTEDFTQTSVFKKRYSQTQGKWILSPVSGQSAFLPLNFSLHVPSTNEKQSEWFLRGIQSSGSNQETSPEESNFLPLIQLQKPSIPVATGKPDIFQGYSSLFELGVTANTDYNVALDLSTENTVNYVSGNSIFSQSSRKSTSQSWEPLTIDSWLILTQLSVAVLIFQIFKTFAQNYGKELLGQLLNLAAGTGVIDEYVKKFILLLMGRRDKGYRVILESQKTFHDIVGVEKFLPEMNEVIYFLRKSSHDFVSSAAVPRGVLLTGPPGTGKTLLVQAIAGEAGVPVVALSGSSLVQPGESGSVRLDMAFQEARKNAPCIVFIDEIDSLAQKRSGLARANPMATDDIVEFLTSFEPSSLKDQGHSPLEDLETSREDQVVESGVELQREQSVQQLGLLTQLLYELDGIKGRRGIIVIGATNRPEVLDPAVLRPGRFDKIVHVGVPDQTKRIEILQFYGETLGYHTDIPWKYLGERTDGFSAADLAALMKESALKAILTQQRAHTLQTIEHGIDRLTTSESEKATLIKRRRSEDNKTGSLSVSSKMEILRLAYYQAGKIVVSSLLKHHPKTVVASLWPRRPNSRSLQITTNQQKTLFEFARLCELTDRLIGCYAGKSAEFLFLEKFASQKSSQRSTLGLEDALFGQQIVYALLEKFSFYSKKTHIQKAIVLAPNRNLDELENFDIDDFAYYQEIVREIQDPPIDKALEVNTSSLEKDEPNIYEQHDAQLFYSIPWWQQETSTELEFYVNNFQNWTRFYLYNPELNERNVEWRPEDEYYHSQSGLTHVNSAFENISKRRLKQKLAYQQKSDFCGRETVPQSPSYENPGSLEDQKPPSSSGVDTKKSEVKEGLDSVFPGKEISVYTPWNDVSNITRDYPAHSLILQSFNKALVILNRHRELVDRLVVELVYHEILRKPEIENLLKDFQPAEFFFETEDCGAPFEQDKTFTVVENSWGRSSRKSVPHWIDFAQF